MFEAGIKLAALGVIARFDPFSYNRILNPSALQHCSKLGKSVRNLARKQCPLCFDFQFLLVLVMGILVPF
jgi:hypothetical protein